MLLFPLCFEGRRRGRAAGTSVPRHHGERATGGAGKSRRAPGTDATHGEAINGLNPPDLSDKRTVFAPARRSSGSTDDACDDLFHFICKSVPYIMYIMYIMYTMYIVYIMYIIYIMYIMYIMHIMYTMYIMYVMYIMYIMYIMNIMYIMYIIMYIMYIICILCI